MPNKFEIKTPRFILKGVTPNLINDFFKNKTKEEIVSFFGADESGYDHLKLMHDNGLESYRISMFYFLLIDKESKRVMGECGFHTWNKAHQRAELFYNLKNDSDKGKGFLTEALPEVLDFGFKELDLHRIQALTADWNIPSLKLLEKFKFTKEGTMREDYIVNGTHENSECYSLLKPEWLSNNK